MSKIQRGSWAFQSFYRITGQLESSKMYSTFLAQMFCLDLQFLLTFSLYLSLEFINVPWFQIGLQTP